MSRNRALPNSSQVLWDWIIFPDGFHAPQLMALAKLQPWTLKPALLAVDRSAGGQ
jgi:hypothetical protein